VKWSLFIGKFAGIKVFIHWTFLILIGWITFYHYQKGYSGLDILIVILFILVVFACVTLHEFGHALMAKRFNFKTRDITLLPIGGLARLEKMPEKPLQELLVAFAGPAVNIVISILLFTYFYLFMPHDVIGNLYEAKIAPENFVMNLMAVNIVLVIFNLIPAFPMDGGRVFRALLSFTMDRVKATKIAASLGQFLAIIFVVFGLMNSHPFIILIVIFVFLGAQAESNFEQTKSTLSGFKVKDILMKDFTVLVPNESLERPIDLLLNSQEKEFIVMDDELVVGVVTRKNLVKGVSESGKSGLVGSIMKKDIFKLEINMPLEKVLTEMQSAKAEIAPVYDNQKVCGVLDVENIMEFLMLQDAQHKFEKS